jgi:hypothetical protein
MTEDDFEEMMNTLFWYLPEAEEAIKAAANLYAAKTTVDANGRDFVEEPDFGEFMRRCETEIVQPRLQRAMARVNDSTPEREVRLGLVLLLHQVTRHMIAEFNTGARAPEPH